MSGNNFVTDIGSAAFEQRVLTSGLALVDFWAEWCGPCKMVAPVLEELSDEMSDEVTVAKIDIDSNGNAPSKYGVRGIPTLLLFKDGEVVGTKVGASPKGQIEQWVRENI